MGEPASGEDRTDDRAKKRVPGWAKMLIAVVVVALVAELWVRAVEDYLPPRTTADIGEVGMKHEALLRLADAKGAGPLVLFVGDSTMDSGVEPARVVDGDPKLGRGYNAALMGARLGPQQMWIDGPVLDTVKPDLVVHGMSPTLVYPLGMDPQLLSIYDSVLEQNLSSISDDVWDRADQFASEHSSLVEHRNSLRQPSTLLSTTIAKVQGSKPMAPPPVRPPGYWDQMLTSDGRIRQFDTVVAPKTIAKETRDVFDAFLDAPADALAIDPIVEVYQRRSIPVVFVIPPVSLELMANSGIDSERWRAVAHKLAERVRSSGHPVIDFTDSGYTREQFADMLHLNQVGAERFSAEMATRLREVCASRPDLKCGT